MEPGKSNSICLKDFFFSYRSTPYLFRKKHFTESDGDRLELCIPELKLPKGKVIGIVGKNGTGKSTFLRCLCGLEKDCRGIIETDGKVYRGNARIGLSYMVMQDVNHQLFTDSVESEVLLSMSDFDHMMKVGQLLRELAQSGKTVLVSTHDPELIEKCCDYELYIKNGRAKSLFTDF